jgi:hypothetical protein
LRNINLKNENNIIYNVLKKHKHLKSIVIEFKKINDTHIFQISGENIEEININGCQNVSDKGIKSIAEKCQNLKKLEVYWIPNLTDEGMSSIFEKCKKIEFLNISGLKHLTTNSLDLIYKNLNNLTHIVNYFLILEFDTLRRSN